MKEKIRYYDALKTISGYQSVEYLRKYSGRDWGLPFVEALEMAYENVLYEAKLAIKGRRRPVANGNKPAGAGTQSTIILGNQSLDPKEPTAQEDRKR